MEELDDLLRREANAEPMHGFEERILHRIASQRNHRSWWVWAAGAVAICGAGIVSWTARSPKPMEQKPVLAIVQSPAAGTSIPPPPKPLPSRPTPSRHALQDHSIAEAVVAATIDEKLPKLDVFPAPVADTAEHRTVAALSDPRVVQATADLKQRQEEVIEIAEIHIAPLSEETQ